MKANYANARVNLEHCNSARGSTLGEARLGAAATVAPQVWRLLAIARAVREIYQSNR
jgi:hypothetical protein